ncbi:MAG: hypothetical protein FJ304_12640, partial [Planctomycetes bacterium]|nr:hypothetical protein [Planctomycetota bacterium]
MTTRRQFLQSSAVLPALLGARADALDMPSDLPRALPPTGADLGTLFPTVRDLAARNRFAYSFLGDTFKTLDEFKAAGRAKVFEAFAYRPEKVEPKAEVVERADCDGYTREKVVFSTSPLFRVPAYVLVPKGLKKPAPQCCCHLGLAELVRDWRVRAFASAELRFRWSIRGCRMVR